MKTILSVAGKSGGHIIPCISYAQKLQKIDPDLKLIFVSSTSPLDYAILKDKKGVMHHYALPLENIPYKKISRYPSFLKNIIISFYQSYTLLKQYKPEHIISTGGSIAVPVCIMGWILKIPVTLFELNAVPGKATLFLARFASQLLICFPEAQKKFPRFNCIITEYPLRPSCFLNYNKIDIITELGFTEHKKTILILGGSQGSQFLNSQLLKLFITHQDKTHHLQIVHQAGNNDIETIKEQYQKLQITAQVFQFSSTIEKLYTIADLVICRSGAGTLFEILHFKKQCITIPLEAHSTDHQVDNAQSFAARFSDQFIMIHQKDVTSHNKQLITHIFK